MIMDTWKNILQRGEFDVPGRYRSAIVNAQCGEHIFDTGEIQGKRGVGHA